MTDANGTTTPVEIERSSGPEIPARVGSSTDVWSFGSRGRLFFTNRRRGDADPESSRSAARNTEDYWTYLPRTSERAAPRAIAPIQAFFGKRGFAPVYQWEGVVEVVTEEGFRGRLIPYEDGRPNPSRVEYADFDLNDLADESDEELVAEGAIFYWTVGRSRTSGGTYTNTSLVRFRRLPRLSPVEVRNAEHAAAALLADLKATR